ncbi:TauD/TfdA family dioxygenase [sulfur-oxidizing endosymbiont of Gigantopelta aegis]|uniref:TauD/TfdA family dioxygenase n=1 Tax=sulfur-oxidizing endosymbiont of Gigantopelta aegis TaxID=2794934 RepID=UPI0018DAFD3E|nr:TauD/TfdA family dioxygenase [sulfur-oxidizing endosymbiont of Gigantopelta aegis]
MLSHKITSSITTPFALNDDDFYQHWRDKKLLGYPDNLGELIVEINDPRQLTRLEKQKLLAVCQKSNMVIYAGKTADDPDPEIPLSMGRAFKLLKLDHNWLADESGLTSLTVVDDGARQNYIPYSNRAINWHTDGYYNKADKQIHGLNLHCVMSAAIGGENRLLDHEIAYLKLRDENPDYIRALMADDVMTIPARISSDGVVARQEEVGPVFSINAMTGDLHMRYTIRTQNVIWKNDPLTQAALAFLEAFLESDSKYIYQGKLEPGMGLISNNVLHDRSAFEDSDQQKRLIYRARYYDRLANTNVHDIYG